MKKAKLRGVVIPMISPLNLHGKVDEGAVDRLVEHIVNAECHPFVLGTTGESLSLGTDSKLTCLKRASKTNAGRKTLYAGISGMCLEESITGGKIAADAGADILVAHLPCYYILPERNMLKYFIELADALPLPLMLYNIKATTHMSIPVEIVKTLAGHPNIIGIKDSERDAERLDTLVGFCRERNDFSYQLGWAAMSTYALNAGADGIVPSTGNAFPDLYRKLYLAVKEGDFEKAENYQLITDEFSLIYQKGKLLSEALPGLKIMLEHLGICASYCISPCYPLAKEEAAQIIKEMDQIMERIPS